MRGRRRRLGLATVVLGVLVACGTGQFSRSEYAVPDGDPGRGADAIVSYGCASCHTIPGIREADANVGPPLENWAERRIIAGRLPNDPEHLIEWIMDPQSIDPGNAMPTLGVSEQDAKDIAAYLYDET